MPAGVVRDSAGIRIVEHAEPDWSAGATWSIADSPAVRIGAVEGDEAYQLYQVRGAARGRDGRIYILNGSTAEVRIFDATGAYVRAVGGQGRGPGEFRYPSQLWLLADDSLGVWDSPLGPRVVFGPDGTLARVDMIDRGALMARLGEGRDTEDVQPLPNGAFLAASWEIDRPDPPVGQLYRPAFELTLLPPDLSNAFSLGTYGGIEQMPFHDGTRLRSSTVLFSPHYQVAAGGTPMRIALGNGDPYELRVHIADGALVTIIRRTTPPAPVVASDRDSAVAQRLAWAEPQGRRPVIERMIAALPEQAHLPAHGRIEIDAAGNLWVQEYPRPSRPGQRWTIYDAQGRLAGTVATSLAMSFAEIGDDYILAIEHDEYDIESVALYPLRKSSIR